MIHDPVLREVASYTCEALVFVVIFVGFHIAHRPDDDGRELVECRCPERFVDLDCYGIHICRDGKRIAPKDFYAEPPEDADAAARAALAGEAQQKKGM